MPTAPQFTNGFHNVLDSHEERLQRVEGTLQDVSTKVAEIGVTTEYLKDSTEKAHASISNKIEDLFEELRSHNEAVTEKIALHHDKLDDLEDRLKPVEVHVSEELTNKKEKWDNWKKVGIGVVIAAAGVLGTKGAEWLLEKIGQ